MKTRHAAMPNLLLLLSVMLNPTLVQAHGFRPALLELHQLDEGRFRVVWKAPPSSGEGSRPVAPMTPHLPDNCQRLEARSTSTVATGRVQHWIVDCGDQGIRGQSFQVAGLTTGREAMVRIWWTDDSHFTAMLRPGAAIAHVPRAGTLRPHQVLSNYCGLGVEHFLSGYDHLLFVLGLLLLLRNRRMLLAAITSFTVGHSLSLALVTLGLAQLPSAPVEAAIALSIVLLAVEVWRRSRPENQPGRTGAREESLLVRSPWAVALGFGVLHGFGFAGALSEVGLPPGGVPLALLGFNLGVEAGQLLFIMCCLLLALALRRLPQLVQQRGQVALVYGMASIAAFWLIQRVAGFWA